MYFGKRKSKIKPVEVFTGPAGAKIDGDEIDSVELNQGKNTITLSMKQLEKIVCKAENDFGDEEGNRRVINVNGKTVDSGIKITSKQAKALGYK
jgi:hypothetical protein